MSLGAKGECGGWEQDAQRIPPHSMRLGMRSVIKKAGEVVRHAQLLPEARMPHPDPAPDPPRIPIHGNIRHPALNNIRILASRS